MLNNHFTKTARRICAIIAACVTFCGHQSRAEVLMVDTRAELDAQDFVDWGVLGETGNDVGTENGAGGVSFSIKSNLQVAFTISKPTAGSFERVDQEPPEGGGWKGNFAPEEYLLSTNSAGPVLIEAGEGMSAVGFQIQPDTTGSVAASQPFDVQLDVFDTAGNSLGTFFNNGTSNANADNSAVFIGVRSDIPNIGSVRVSTNWTKNGGVFAINRISVAYARYFEFTGEGIYGVTVFRELVLFDSANPGTILSKAPITGLTAQNNNESLRAIDFRPATEELYGVGNQPGGIFRLYKINPDTGAASQIGGTLQGVPASLGFNFEPPLDQVRIVSDAEQNFRYNPTNAALVANDGNLAYASGDPGFGTNPNVVTLSYTNSVPGATETTLYVIDTARDVLAIQQPNSGVLTTVGSLGIDVPSFIDPASFEISPQSGVAYLSLINPGTQQSFLYTVNLATGAATLVGEIGENSLVRSISTRIKPQAAPTPRPSATPTPTPAPTPEIRLWVAGRDLAANEKPDREDEKISINTTIQQWGYGYRAEVEGTDLNLFSTASHTNNGRAGETREAVEGWAADEGVVLVNTGTEPVQYLSTGGNVPFKPLMAEQIMLQQSALALRPVVRWVAPAAGDYRITAEWLDLNPEASGGAAHVVIDGIVENGQRLPLMQVFGQQVDGKYVGQQWADERVAMMPTKTFTLAEGAVVDFVLGTRASETTRETAFTAAIARVPKVTVSPPAQVQEGEDIPVNVAVEHPFPIKEVKLLVNGTEIGGGPHNTPPFNLVIRDLGPGPISVTAVAIDESGTEGVSAPAPVFVFKNSGARSAMSASGRKTGETDRAAASSGGQTYRCSQSGVWQDPATWGGQGVPGRYDDAIIPAGFEVTQQDHVEIDNFDLAGRLLSSYATVVYGKMQASGSLIGSAEQGQSAVLTISESGDFANVANQVFFENVTCLNYGTSTVGQNGSISSRGSIIRNYGTIDILGRRASNDQTYLLADRADLQGGFVRVADHAHLLVKDGIVAAGAGNIVAAGAGNLQERLAKQASLIGADGATLIGPDGASLIGADGASIVAAGAGNAVNVSAAALIGPDGATLIGPDGASLVPGARTSTAKHAVRTMSGQSTDRSGRAEAAEAFSGISLEGGTVSGNMTLAGNVVNSGGFIAPGNSAGRVRIRGNYTQEGNGTLVMDVGGTGTNPLQFDQLQISGTANLGGKLIVKTIDGFTPQSGDSFAPITYSAVNGSFDSVSSNAQISFGENGATMQVSGPNPPAPKALNIATRMRVETGDNVLIAGFIVTGSEPKRVLVRGIGTSLPIEGALSDPTLDLDGGAFFNDDWKTDQEQEISDSTLAPPSDLESAIVATLEPGLHTAVLRGKNDGTGVGLVEVYDLNSAAPAQLANISTRGQVQTGDNVMIGGFIIGGDYPARVLIRAIGPSLPVEGNLQDPTLELVDSNGGRISNDDWRSTQEAEIIATTVQPPDDKEAAIVATLVPGAYTAVVRGKDESIGIALVEGYNLQ